MTPAVPRARPDESAGQVLARLRESCVDEAGHVYLVDADSILVGQVPVESLLTAGPETRLDRLQGEPPVEVEPQANAETAALLAVERHDADVAVVNGKRRLLGAIPIGRLLALLHDEHVDDFLRLGGVGVSHPAPTEEHEPTRVLWARLPWLLLGLAGSSAMVGLVSTFRAPIDEEIALAFFLPAVVYMADAIGTQTETVLVRSLAYGPVPLGAQMAREGRIGLLLGVALGAAAAAGLELWGYPSRVALAVGLSLLATAVEATLVASLLPWGLARLRTDPALASGPLATVVQDLLSVAIYLAIGNALF